MILYHGTSLDNAISILRELKIYTNYNDKKTGCWLASKREHAEIFGDVIFAIKYDYSFIENNEFLEASEILNERKKYISFYQNLELDDDWNFYHNGFLDISIFDFDVIFRRCDDNFDFLTSQNI